MWEECKNVFDSSSNKELKRLLENIVEVIKINYEAFQKVADLEFLNYIMEMDVDEFCVGTSGDNFESMAKSYLAIEDMSVEKIWKILSQLVWDLTVPVTDKICPFCHCDHLVILTNKEKDCTYLSCETCFWISDRNGTQIARPNSLFPANKDII